MSLATTCGSRLASAAVCTTIHGVVSSCSCCSHSARVAPAEDLVEHRDALGGVREAIRAGGEAGVVEQVAAVDHLAEVLEVAFGLDPDEVDLPAVAGR